VVWHVDPAGVVVKRLAGDQHSAERQAPAGQVGKRRPPPGHRHRRAVGEQQVQPCLGIRGSQPGHDVGEHPGGGFARRYPGENNCRKNR